jgi:hypothetical protein
MKPTEDEVQQAIESSGYPLEIRVAHALATRGYLDVTPSWDYRDDRTGESREIDVAASRSFEVRKGETRYHSAMLHLLIECKRSPAFVIYSAHPPTILTRDSDPMSLSYFGRPGTLFTERHGAVFLGMDIVEHLQLGVSRWKWPDCVGSHYSFVHAIKDQKKSNSKKLPVRPQFKAGDEDFYHKKLLGLLKGAYKYREPYLDRIVPKPPGFVQPHFLIPILVVEADLYEYNVASTTLRPIVRGALCRSYRGEFSASFRIDVVQEEELTAYLQDLEKDFSSVASEIGEQHSLWEQALEYEAELNSHSDAAAEKSG